MSSLAYWPCRLASNAPRDVFEALIAPLQRAVSLIVPYGRGVLRYSPVPLRPNQDHSISIANGEPVRLTGEGLYLDCIHDFRIVEDPAIAGVYRAITTAHSYALLDHRRRELVTYHYHPAGGSWCTYPHLHVGTASGIIDNKAHLATGHITLPAVIRMLIEDPAIPVVSLRPVWAHVLELNGDLDDIF